MKNQYSPKKVDAQQIKFYENAWENDEQNAGAFYDVGQAIQGAKSSVLIQGWFIEDIPLGETATDGNKKTLAQILMKKIIEDPHFTAFLHTFNHTLSPMVSNYFYKNLREAGLSYIEQKKKDGDLDQTTLMRLESIAADLKQGKFPRQIVWRASRGVDGTNFSSRHQKFVVVDNETTFVGGLDLGSGRSYSSQYTIKDKNEAPFRDQYYQIKDKNIAADLIDEFAVQLLSKTRKKSKHVVVKLLDKFKKRSRFASKTLHTDKENREIFLRKFYIPHVNRLNNEAPGVDNRNIQILRTMPRNLTKQLENALTELSSNVAENIKSRWDWKVLNQKRDTSIQFEYIKAIQGAQKFIYIEAQNFTVSDINDSKYKNHIPLEIIEKIVQKAVQNKHADNKLDFHVYVNLPMFPMLETNDPRAMDSKLLSLAQQDTIRNFYKTLEHRFKEKGIQEPITNYITFASLAKHEIDDSGEKLSQVYNHSKMLNVDDETLIIGSANITERSMSGKKDSEVGVKFDAKNDPELKEKIKRQRSNLMASSLGKEFSDKNRDLLQNNPESLQLVTKIHGLQEKNSNLINRSQTKRNSLLYTYSSYHKHEAHPKYPKIAPEIDASKTPQVIRKIVSKITKRSTY